MEWQDRIEINSKREQSPERHGKEVRGAQGGDFCGDDIRGEIQSIPGQ